MTNEIKEIQERLDYHKAIGIEPEYCEDLITTGELQRLLDYITNLQQRIDKAVEYIKWNLDKNEELIEYFNYDANFNELLNILRGDE
jgi:hypothetical protein